MCNCLEIQWAWVRLSTRHKTFDNIISNLKRGGFALETLINPYRIIPWYTTTFATTMNVNPTSQDGCRLSSSTRTNRMGDKDLYLELMSELMDATTENRITKDFVTENRCGNVKPSAKTATLQRFFDREKHERKWHPNNVASDADSDEDNDDDDDDDHDEFYQDDEDTVSSMMVSFKNLHSSFSSMDVLMASRVDIQATNDIDSDMDTFDSMHLYESPAKRYSSTPPSKPKYNRDRMDAKQLDLLSTSLHTSDGTEVTATETDYSLNGSSHHSPTTMKRSPNPNGRQYSSVKLTEFPPTVTVYEGQRDSDKDKSHVEIDTKNIASLHTHCLLGEGNFGKVYMVSAPSDATNKTCYALKVISKYHLLCEDQVHTAMRENEILSSCSHPNIATLYATQQDASSLYLLQAYIPGGDLFHMMHHFSSCGTDSMTTYERHPILSEESNVQFYVACIADALWYLHCGVSNASAIVYRDLKHENIMINERGYPMLIDFGYAKQLEATSLHCDSEGNACATSTKTYTMCGTAKYISPEIIEGIGHSCSTDYWSLGVVVYELCGRAHPFEFVANTDDFSLYRNIAEADYIPLPDDISADGTDFVDQLLAKDSKARLGTTETPTYNPILFHPWLRKWDVTLLRQQSFHAPWIPSLDRMDPTAVPTRPQNIESDEGNDDSFVFDMDHHTDSHLTTKEQSMFAGF